MKSFKELGISDGFVKGLEELGIQQPTPIQEQAIPFLLSDGGDFIAQAQTGTGKTAAFGVPLLAKIDPKLKEIQGLIVAPTRELAKQIGKQLFRFTKYTEKIFIEVVTGGDNLDRQVLALKRPTHIVVATPGRLIDLLKRKALSIAIVKRLILDEADEMLSMGFSEQLGQIFSLTRDRDSTWLFSATIPTGIRNLIKDNMSPQAYSLKIDKAHVVNRDIAHQFIICGNHEKTDRITDFLKRQGQNRGVIFCRTKAGAVQLGEQLRGRGFTLEVLHGDIIQKDRDTVMRAIKKSRVQFLIATDVAARGIDVADLSFVIHHQLPDQTEYYTHRSGRTARAGKKGISVVFLPQDERPRIKALEEELGLTFTQVK